jgi:hypothetical protein
MKKMAHIRSISVIGIAIEPTGFIIDGVRSEATHWMPLPAPPSETETSAVEGDGA